MNIVDEVFEYIKNKYHTDGDKPFLYDDTTTTFRDKLSEKWFALYMSVKKSSVGIQGDGCIDIINVKADPDFISFVAGTTGYLPAYHMSKKHWLTIRLDGTLDLNDIKDRIDDSYDLIVNTPTRRIYEAVKHIPAGSVATYGQVAELAGDKKMARAVGNALHKNPDPDNIPCFRIVNSKGELAGDFAFGGREAQAKLLEAEGIRIVDGKVDLKVYGIDVESILQKGKA